MPNMSPQDAPNTGMHKYKKLRVIGSGTYGKVYKVRCLDDNLQYVMKRVTLAQNSQEDKDQALLEVEVLSSLRHPHIVPYKECFWDEDELDLCMVMSYCEGGDLYHYVQNRRKQGRKIEEEEAWMFMIQMIFALAYLHAKKILHRDVKSQNIFLSNGKCQLGDFGLAKKLEESFELARTPIGTPFYMAPEIMEGRPYAFKSDVWALGCVMYEVLTGKPAFAANNFPGVAMKVLSGHYEPISDDYSQELRDAVSKMLCNNVNARPFIFQLIEVPSIMSRAHSYLSVLETEHIQSGLMGTWRGAIPIVTHPVGKPEHISSIPKGKIEGLDKASSKATTGRTTGERMSVSNSSKSTLQLMGQQVQPPERLEIPDDPHEDSSVQDAVSALGNDLAGHSLISPWRDSVLETSQATGTSYTNRHANRMICQDEKTGLEGSLVSTGPVKLQLDTLHVSDLRLSIASSIIGNPESSILAKCLPTSDNDKESSCQSHRMAKTLPVAGSVPCVFPMLPSTSLDEIEFAAATGDSSTVARELTAGAQALSNEERSALRSQLDQLRAISKCVQKAGISDNSGDLSEAEGHGLGIDLWDVVISKRTQSSEIMRKDGYALNIEDVDGGDYSDDFEDDDEEMERIRGEWMEQQRRRDVQRQWNIEAAEAVPEEMAGVHTTPQRISSDEDGDASEEDRDSVVEEVPRSMTPPVLKSGFSEAQRNLGMPSIAPESRLVQRTEAQRKLAERESRLRQRCIDSLGEPVYTQLYEFLKERGKLYSDDDDMALKIELSGFLDDAQMAYWPLVDELLFFDQTRGAHQ